MLFFPVVDFISYFSLDITEGALLFCRRGGLQDACLVTGGMMADYFLSVQYPGTVSLWAASPSPQRLRGGTTPGRILAALPQGSLAIAQHYLSDVLWPETRSGPAAGRLGAGRLPKGRPGLFVLWMWFNARQ